MDTLGELIQKSGASAYCLYAASDMAEMRYLTRFVTHDPVPVIVRPDEKPLMIVPQMEADRAIIEANAEIITRKQAGYFEISEKESDPWKITAAMINRQTPGPYLVPPVFPAALAQALSAFNDVRIEKDGALSCLRAVKTDEEINWITRAQHAAEAAMEGAIKLIRNAEVRSELLWNGEEPLTSDRIRYEINHILLSYDCSARDTIVSCGDETAQPHCIGKGQIQAHEPIVIDLFPYDNSTGYYADMTRTVSRGEPSGAVKELYDTVAQAVSISEQGIREGISGALLYQKVRDFFDELGYSSDLEGFTHSLGHGVGLEVHEKPSLSPLGEPLKEGNVITVEPGLYYRNIGGVRIENLGVVRRKGFERITNFPQDLVV
jgi:Xaa-Pro aminopeptidase